jgi:predicted HicB family RNase H-like nuclease
MSRQAPGITKGSRAAQGTRRLLTFRLDQEQRQRLKARLAREGRTMSEVVTHGLRQYVQHARAAGSAKPAVTSAKDTEKLVLPDRIAARLRELRATGHSDLLSATLAALNEAGWPLRPLADALGISRQAVQARVRRRGAAALREHVTNCEPPPPFPHRRMASAAGFRPHLTIKIDHSLRASAHQAAADEGSSLTQVVEAILDRYLRHGIADADHPPAPAPRRASGRAAGRVTERVTGRVSRPASRSR